MPTVSSSTLAIGGEAVGGAGRVRDDDVGLGVVVALVDAHTLATSLGYDASLIRNICYLGLYRLDNDNIDLNWIGKFIVQSTVNILELTP